MRVSDSFKITRRDLMVVGAVTIAAGAAPAMALEQPEGSTTAWPEDFLPKVAFTVNGEPRSHGVVPLAVEVVAGKVDGIHFGV